MADGSDRESQAEEQRKAEFDMEFVPNLPGGRALFPAEREGRFVFLVAIGAMTEQCFDEMVRHLQGIVGTGQWSQNWHDGSQPAAGPSPAAAHTDESLFDMEWRRTLPGGASILPDESAGRFVWLVKIGAMTRRCFEEMRAYLTHIVGTGQWSQNWGDRPQPGN